MLQSKGAKTVLLSVNYSLHSVLLITSLVKENKDYFVLWTE